MAKKNLVSHLKTLLEPVVTEAGFELFDVAFVKEGQNHFVRVTIDKAEGVTIEDCETISRRVEKVLDEKDPIPDAYILEVCSPGIDRPLVKEADFEKYKGQMVDVKLYKAKNGHKVYQGTLLGLAEGIVTIDDPMLGVQAFTIEEMASCRLAVIF